jgi:hypothetical protein
METSEEHLREIKYRAFFRAIWGQGWHPEDVHRFLGWYYMYPQCCIDHFCGVIFEREGYRAEHVDCYFRGVYLACPKCTEANNGNR